MSSAPTCRSAGAGGRAWGGTSGPRWATAWQSGVPTSLWARPPPFLRHIARTWPEGASPMTRRQAKQQSAQSMRRGALLYDRSRSPVGRSPLPELAPGITAAALAPAASPFGTTGRQAAQQCAESPRPRAGLYDRSRSTVGKSPLPESALVKNAEPPRSGALLCDRTRSPVGRPPLPE